MYVSTDVFKDFISRFKYSSTNTLKRFFKKFLRVPSYNYTNKRMTDVVLLG